MKHRLARLASGADRDEPGRNDVLAVERSVDPISREDPGIEGPNQTRANGGSAGAVSGHTGYCQDG